MAGYPTLLEQFVREECTPHVRKLICDAALNRSPEKEREQFEFNRFNLVLDFIGGRATIDDETDTTRAGSVDVGLGEFLAAIQCTVAKA